MSKFRPNNNEAEKAVLGGFLVDPSLVPEYIGQLNDDCFINPRHSLIFQALKRLYAQGTGIDPLNLSNELDKTGQGGENGSLSEIRGLMVTDFINPLLTGDHVETLVKVAMRRKIHRLGLGLINEAEFAEPEDLLAKIDRAVSGIEMAESDVIHIGSISEGIYKDLGNKEYVSQVYKTGFTALDRILAIEPSDFVLVGAPTSHGKTIFLLQTAMNMVTSGEHKALFISLEMTARQNVNRIISQLTGVPLEIVKRNFGNGYNQSDWLKMAQIRDKIANLPLWFNHPKKRTLPEIVNLIKAAVHKYGVDVVFVDYGQKVYVPQHRGNEEGRVHAITDEFRALSLALNIPIIAGMQLNRRGSGDRDARTEKDLRPRKEDIKGSGYAEQDSSITLLIWLPEKYKLETIEWQGQDYSTEGLAEIIVAKQRDGGLGSVLMGFEGKCVRFTEYRGQSVMPDEYVNNKQIGVPF